MRKYLLRYVYLWIPAAVAVYLPTVILPAMVPSLSGLPASIPVHILQWVCALIMLIGWSLNTGMLSYHYPWNTAACLLGYYGISLVLVSLLYWADSGTLLKALLDIFAGLISFKPLHMFDRALKTVFMRSEFAVINILVACCAVGYVMGLIFRRTHPNPYRPKLYRR